MPFKMQSNRRHALQASLNQVQISDALPFKLPQTSRKLERIRKEKMTWVQLGCGRHTRLAQCLCCIRTWQGH